MTEPRAKLGAAIREWVHLDRLAESFTAQAMNARKLRAEQERTAIDLIKQLNLTRSTIQVSGAKLNLVQRRQPGGLTWSYLEREIPVWAARSGVSAAHATGLIKWLHDHRDVKEVEVLKKTVPGAKESDREEE
jgi:hypothetical protein